MENITADQAIRAHGVFAWTPSGEVDTGLRFTDAWEAFEAAKTIARREHRLYQSRPLRRDEV